jgi:hypothetical protein
MINSLKKPTFKIELKKIHWLANYGDENELDLCAHGKICVIIGNEIVADNSPDSNDWWSLTAMALHLLRTLEMNHTSENPVGDCLVPGEGHHIDHHPNNPIVHIETAYPMVEGKNWWVIHLDKQVKLITESSKEVVIQFVDYKSEILSFVDKVQCFYNTSKPKTLPENEYDKEGYLKLWKEWKLRRNKWK